MGYVNPHIPRPTNLCQTCNGTGRIPAGQPRTITCPVCKGTGAANPNRALTSA